MDKISMVGVDKAAVLAGLYNASKPLGMGFMHYDSTPMTCEEAAEILSQQTDFDYLKGRVMKVDLSGHEFDPWGYDRDNGEGAAQAIVDGIRETNEVNPVTSQEKHQVGTMEQAEEVRSRLHEESRTEHLGRNTVVMHLGLNDVADVLGPAVDRAMGDTPVMGCKEEDCTGTIDWTKRISLQTGCRSTSPAFPCAECGRLHWSSGEMVFNRQEGRVFLEDGCLVLRNEDGEIIDL